MSQTLRREVRKTIETVLNEWGIGADEHDVPALAVEISDKIFDLPFFKKQDKPYDKSQADPAWEILFGNRTQEQVDETKLTEDALNEFMRALKLPASFNWYPNHKVEETAMKVLRDMVVSIYKQDKTAFTRYETWRQNPYARGAIPNSTIKSYPEKFVYSWSDFERSEGGSSKSTNNSQVEMGDDGIPRTY